MNLTPTQRRILTAMAQDETGFAAFTGERSRKFSFGIIPAKYGTPEFFLKSRGLIERQERNVAGTWFRLTEAGRSAARGAIRL